MFRLQIKRPREAQARAAKAQQAAKAQREQEFAVKMLTAGRNPELQSELLEKLRGLNPVSSTNLCNFVFGLTEKAGFKPVTSLEEATALINPWIMR